MITMATVVQADAPPRFSYKPSYYEWDEGEPELAEDEWDVYANEDSIGKIESFRSYDAWAGARAATQWRAGRHDFNTRRQAAQYRYNQWLKAQEATTPRLGSGAKIANGPSPESYRAALDKAMKNHPNAGFVTYYDPSEIKSRNMTVILENGGDTGCLIIDHGNGDIECAGLFSVAGKGTGFDLLKRTIDQYGVNYVEAFEGLSDAYTQLGFRPESTTPWNDDYAPRVWNYEAHGTPGVVTMRLR
jgi:hypothetical protein